MKRNIYIAIGGAVVLILVIFGVYFIFFRSPKISTDNSQSSPTVNPNDAPLFGNGRNIGGENNLFANSTPLPTIGNSTLTVAERNAAIFAENVSNGNTVCAWMNNPSGQGTDLDSDDFPDNVEKIYNTDPAKPDTDNDGYKDGNEVKNGYNPLVAGGARLDSNNNGIFDNQECKQNTNPLAAKNTVTGANDDSVGLSGVLNGDAVVGTPIPTTKPTATPAATQQTPSSIKLNTILPTVNTDDFHVSQSNTPQAIKNYLVVVKSGYPAELTNNVYFVNALVQAFAGKTEEIQKIRTHISDYNKTLTTMLVPSGAVEYHKQLISINKFIEDRFGIIQNNAKTNPQVAMKAAQELQVGLPAAISNLNLMQDKLIARSVL
jgi:hypothetical protein